MNIPPPPNIITSRDHVKNMLDFLTDMSGKNCIFSQLKIFKNLKCSFFNTEIYPIIFLHNQIFVIFQNHSFKAFLD